MANIPNARKKILLVDDDEMHLSTAELFLKDEYELYKTKSGEEALNCLSNNEFTPDLILLDIIMPKMDGWEVFKRLQKMGLQNIPIVFLTSEDGEKEKKKARSLGAVDYITKPYNMTFLKSTIAEVLEVKNQNKHT
jgi:DNA-binding response OmpR family regulator